MTYSLLLYDRLAISTTNRRDNITRLARNWRRSTKAVGGFWTGDFSISAEDLSHYWLKDFYNNGIGWRVVEKSGSKTTWEGEIVQLRLTLDGVTWLRSMDPERWRNRVKVMWGGGETAWGEDTASTALYGDSEYIDQGSAVYTDALALARRDKIMPRDAYPRSRAEGGLIIDPARKAPPDGLSVLCAGYVFSMNRRYQETNVTAANISAQIGTLVGNSEYVTAGRIDANTTQAAIILAGTPMRLWDAVAELIDMGDDSNNDWAGGVYADRLFNYNLAETAVTHYWRNGRVYDTAGTPVASTRVRPDILVEIVGAPHSVIVPGAAAWDKPNRAYIETVEFQAPDKLTLIPRVPKPAPETLNEMTRRVIGFADKYAAFRHAVSTFSGLPGLRGLWTMADYDVNGNAEDQTNYDLLLTRNGNPMYNYDGLVPYILLDGAVDHFSRADEAATSITGTEAHIHADVRGLTLGAWVYPQDIANTQIVIGKWGAVGSYSYVLLLAGTGAGDPLRFYISDDGTNADAVESSGGYASATWQFVVARFSDHDAGEELAVWLNDVKTTAATARAAIDDNGSNFTIGANSAGGNIMFGRVSLTFLCAAALPDDMIGALFQQSRALFGV